MSRVTTAPGSGAGAPGNGSSGGDDLATLVGHVWRREAPHVLVALLRRGSALQDCEDATQEALLAAAEQWSADGIPGNPRGWLIRVASRRLIDQQRSESARQRREITAAYRAEHDRPASRSDHSTDLDDSLQLLVLCAHPCLSDTSAVALTLRAVAGLTTSQIAAGLLVSETTAAQRISRAKKALRAQGAGFGSVPTAELSRRLHAVRHVLHLVFTAGSAPADGPDLVDTSLTAEAIRLTERLHRALPRDDETTGLLALMLLVDARTPARTTESGALITLAEQDRSRWNHDAIDRAVALLEQCLPAGTVGPFQLQAAIAAVHSTAATFADTDWPQILELYRMLQKTAPSPAVDLAAAIALSEVEGARAGLDALVPLLTQRPNDHRVIAAQAHLLEAIGHPRAPAVYQQAVGRARHPSEVRYLRYRASTIDTEGSGPPQ